MFTIPTYQDKTFYTHYAPKVVLKLCLSIALLTRQKQSTSIILYKALLVLSPFKTKNYCKRAFYICSQFLYQKQSLENYLPLLHMIFQFHQYYLWQLREETSNSLVSESMYVELIIVKTHHQTQEGPVWYSCLWTIRLWTPRAHVYADFFPINTWYSTTGSKVSWIHRYETQKQNLKILRANCQVILWFSTAWRVRDQTNPCCWSVNHTLM